MSIEAEQPAPARSHCLPVPSNMIPAAVTPILAAADLECVHPQHDEAAVVNRSLQPLRRINSRQR